TFEFVGATFFTPKELINISGLKDKGIDPFSLEEAKESIIKAYTRKGFFDVDVSYTMEGRKVVFMINEGQRYRVVKGNTIVGFYDEDVLEQELSKTIQKLKAQGYTLADGSIYKDIDRAKKLVKVELNIQKGKKQILKAFIYEGNNKKLRKVFEKHNAGLPKIYNSNLVERLNLDIQAYFKKEGFMEGDYNIDVQLEEKEDAIYYTYIYRITEGPRYRLGGTLYYGYDKTTSRELSYMTRSSEYYSSDLDEETLYNFLSSGIFSGVFIDTFADGDKKEVYRLMQLSEDKRGLFDFTFGYNTEDRLSLEAFLGFKNLFGIGLESSLRYRKTGKYELYNLELQDKFLFSRRYWFKYDMFKEREEHKSFNLDVKGLN
ncbi:MAG: outer membrane protein assembly factor, partial [Aquificota bacterium]